MAVKKASKTSTRLSPALAAENERFRMCVLARLLLPMRDANAKIRRKAVSPYQQERWYRGWQKELIDAGFQFVQHFDIGFADYSAFTNCNLGFDALLSEGDKPGCEVTAYHRDHTVTTVANYADLLGPEFAPSSRVWTEFKGASPVQLVAQLKKLVRAKKLSHVDATTFASRYTEVTNRLSHETGERALQTLKTPTVLIGGAPPRWERVGCYFDFVGAGWKSPSFSSANWTRDWKRGFAAASSNPPRSTANAIDAAMTLITASHLQLASAPGPNDFLSPASDVALAHFHAIATAPKGCHEAMPWFLFRALLRGLLLCALAGRWETFKQICNLVDPNLASAKTADDEELDFAQVLLLLVSIYRDRSLPKAAALEQGVARRLAKRPRLLLEIRRAISAGRAGEVDKALRRSLAYFMKELRGDRLVPAQWLPRKQWNDMFRFVALPESLFYLTALERGLTLPPLPLDIADMLITPESIGVR